jgi:hypothetical protein
MVNKLWNTYTVLIEPIGHTIRRLLLRIGLKRCRCCCNFYGIRIIVEVGKQLSYCDNSSVVPRPGSSTEECPIERYLDPSADLFRRRAEALGWGRGLRHNMQERKRGENQLFSSIIVWTLNEYYVENISVRFLQCIVVSRTVLGTQSELTVGLSILPVETSKKGSVTSHQHWFK